MKCSVKPDGYGPIITNVPTWPSAADQSIVYELFGHAFLSVDDHLKNFESEEV
jgi:hypothetical protein